MKSFISSTANTALQGAKVGGIISAVTAASGFTMSFLMMLSNHSMNKQTEYNAVATAAMVAILAPIACAGMGAVMNISKSAATVLLSYKQKEEPLLPVHNGHLKQRKGRKYGLES